MSFDIFFSNKILRLLRKTSAFSEETYIV